MQQINTYIQKILLILAYFLVDKGENLLYNNKQRFNMRLCGQL